MPHNALNTAHPELPLVPAVFFDRDDTLVKDVGHCTRPEDISVLPGAADATRKLKDAGYLIVLVTNQSVIGRGLATHEGLREIHDRMITELERESGVIDAIYYCPHLPRDECSCRKPEPGLVLQAVAEHGIDIGASFFIGDKQSDVDAAIAAGCTPILIQQDTSVISTDDEVWVRTNALDAATSILEHVSVAETY